MDKKFIVAAFFTKDTPYEIEVKNLISSLEKNSLPYDIIGIHNQGTWQKNTQYKAYFIKTMLMKHFPQNILYLDVDAVVQQYPTLINNISADFGAFFWKESPNKENELIGSCLYFANNPITETLVQRWIDCNMLNPNKWDQHTLQYVLEESDDLPICIEKFPKTYCKIFDLMAEVKNPVIEQFQASRRFKSIIDKERGEEMGEERGQLARWQVDPLLSSAWLKVLS